MTKHSPYLTKHSVAPMWYLSVVPSVRLYCLLYFQGFDSENKRRCDILENLVSLGCEYSFIKQPDHQVTIDQVSAVC